MLGHWKAFKEVPFFWTRHYDCSIQYVGHCTDYDEIHIIGDTTLEKYGDNKFVAFYIKNDVIEAAAIQGRSHDALTLIEAFKNGFMPSGKELKSGKVTLEMLKKRLNPNA